MKHGDSRCADGATLDYEAVIGLATPIGTPVSDEVRIAQVRANAEESAREWERRTGRVHPALRDGRLP